NGLPEERLTRTRSGGRADVHEEVVLRRTKIGEVDVRSRNTRRAVELHRTYDSNNLHGRVAVLGDDGDGLSDRVSIRVVSSRQIRVDERDNGCLEIIVEREAPSLQDADADGREVARRDDMVIGERTVTRCWIRFTLAGIGEVDPAFADPVETRAERLDARRGEKPVAEFTIEAHPRGCGGVTLIEKRDPCGHHLLRTKPPLEGLH